MPSTICAAGEIEMRLDELAPVAGLLATRNAIDAEIASIIGRSANAGHVGECIAAQVFHITLEKSAVAKAVERRFGSCALAGAAWRHPPYG